jgi:hypothetical protein
VIPASEWKFFEGTEQRIKHLVKHERENRHALLRGQARPWDPIAQAQRMAALLQDLDYPARVEQALAADPTPEQERRLHLHRRWALRALFETHPDLLPLRLDLEEKILTFTPQVRGRGTPRAELRRILRQEEDRTAREAAWEALNPLGEALAGDLTELIRRREALARAVAGTGFPAVAFLANEQDRSQAVGLLDQVERYTRQVYEEARKEVARTLGVQEVEPWDLEFGLTRLGGPLSPPSLERARGAMEEQLDRWGFPAPGSLEEADLPFEEEVLAVESPGDVRALVSPEPDAGLYERVLSAAGRVLSYGQVATPRFFLQEQNPALVEVAGALLAGVARSPGWLVATTGLGSEEAAAALRARRLFLILRLRRDVAQTVFENLVYAQSDLDPHRLYSEVVEHMLFETRRPAPRWPLDLYRITDPLRRASRVLGVLVAAQLAERMEQLFPEPWRRREAGNWLREEVLAGGSALPWVTRVERATGSAPAIDSLARELGLRFEGPTMSEAEGISDEEAEDYFKDIDLDDLE